MAGIVGFLEAAGDSVSSLVMSGLTEPMAVNNKLAVENGEASLHWGVRHYNSNILYHISNGKNHLQMTY